MLGYEIPLASYILVAATLAGAGISLLSVVVS